MPNVLHPKHPIPRKDSHVKGYHEMEASERSVIPLATLLTFWPADYITRYFPVIRRRMPWAVHQFDFNQSRTLHEC